MTNEQQSKQDKSLSRRSVEGTAILIGTRFLVRMIGFISVSITARLLTPEDFGLVGAASLVLVLFEVLNQIGLREYIIRTQKIDIDELHTLWTLRLIISTGIAAVIYLTAPWAALLLQEERLVEVLQVLCVVSVLGALRSPATEFFNRDLQYGKDLVLKSADKIVAVTVTIGCAYYFRTYWALVWGQLAGASFAIISSQVARSFRPKLTFAKAANVRSFAFWTFVVGLNSYGIRHVDEWIAKRSSDSAGFGAYHISRDLCRLFVAELIAPAGQVFFPGAAKVQADPVKLSEVVSRFAGAAFIASFAVAAGISSVSEELVYLLLGYQWEQAIQYMPYVAFATAAVVLGDLFSGLYVIADRQQVSARFRTGRLGLILIGSGVAAYFFKDLLAIAMALAAMSVLSVAIELAWLFAKSRFNVSLLGIVWRPAIAASVMFAAVDAVGLSADWSLVIVAAAKVFTGAAVYCLTLFLLWRLSGTPEGGETEFLNRIREYF